VQVDVKPGEDPQRHRAASTDHRRAYRNGPTEDEVRRTVMRTLGPHTWLGFRGFNGKASPRACCTRNPIYIGRAAAELAAIKVSGPRRDAAWLTRPVYALASTRAREA
jgi:hypothetical protein